MPIALLVLSAGCDCGATSHTRQDAGPPEDAGSPDATPDAEPPWDAGIDAGDAGTERTFCIPGSLTACSSDRYCRGPDFARCGGKDVFNGSCELRPSDCAGEPSSPVCGCDGVTYDNECAAQRAGVDATDGACPPGPLCSALAPCAADTYCDGDGACTDVWYCVPASVPRCRSDRVAYCGCGGVTWFDSSNCPRRPYAHVGECSTDPDPALCDPREVVCDSVPPTCGLDYVPSVRDGCWSRGCVPVTTCACAEDAACPGREWVCDVARGRCRPR